MHVRTGASTGAAEKAYLVPMPHLLASVDEYFRAYCEDVESLEQGAELFAQLPSAGRVGHFHNRAMTGAPEFHLTGSDKLRPTDRK